MRRHPLESFRDPRELELLLDDVWGYRSSAAQDAIAIGAGLDVDELESYSAWRKVYLARYGRQSMLQWDNVLVTEIQLLLKELMELIRREHGLQSHNEDHAIG